MVNLRLAVCFFLTFVNVLHVLCDLPSETATDKVDEPFPQEKCESALKGCSCNDYEIIAGIICNNVTDFSNFSKTLAYGSIFEINTTYEITVENLQSLPPRSMEGLIVFRLYLDDPGMETIEKGAFGGVLRLRRFHIRRSSIQEIPDFRVIKDSLRKLNIENSRLTSLEGDGLKDLYLIESLSFFNNSISHVDPYVFQGTSNVIIFDISYNELTHLPSHIFDTWKLIKKIVLSHNKFLHVDQLFAVARPQFIYLDFNNLTDVDTVLHQNMTQLETIILSNNPLEKISKKSFNGKIPKVRFLYLDHCNISRFDVSHYENLNILATLDLSWNSIEQIYNQSIEFGYLVELDFTGNKIWKFEAEITFSVKRLYLQKNKLSALDRALQFTQISEVSVAGNKLGFLSVEDFRGVHGMQVIGLKNNKISRIDRFTFLSIRNDLHYLDLSFNRLRALNGSVKYMSQLKSINLTNNLIEIFEEGEFIGLNELAELYLTKNKIAALTFQLKQLPQLQFLVINDNHIANLSPEQIPNRLQFIHMADNPFKCDCKLLPFLQWLKRPDSPGSDIVPCALATEAEEIKSVTEPCPDPCSCMCHEDSGSYFISVDCSGRNISGIPFFLLGNYTSSIQDTAFRLKHLQKRLKFPQNSDRRFSISDEVLGIDLSNNSLESMNDARLPTPIRHLNIANNRLQQLPESMLYSLPKLKRVQLTGNPWKCDCNAAAFKNWILSKADVVADVNITRCGASGSEDPQLNNRVISSLTDWDLCPADIGFYISLAFGLLSFCLVCAASTILYTRYQLHIKVWLYSRGVTWVKEKDIDMDKKFDAFISFSHFDSNFVTNQIISVIENKAPNVRLCLHYRDFMPGEFIHDNILNAVASSKRTILVLSKNFLESEWCLMEFRAAHVQALKDRVHRIIVIKVGELPKDIDPSIKVYLDSTTYLQWGDKYFWNNLLYALPTSGPLQDAKGGPGRRCYPRLGIDNKMVQNA